MMSINSSMPRPGLSIQRDAGIDHLAEIVRRDVGRHADAMPPAPFTRRLGKRAGSTTGSFSLPS